MLKHLKNSQIDYQKWDTCIDSSSQGIVYALSWYLDIVKPNWEAIVWEQSNQYLAVMPLPINTKIGIKHIYQPLYAQQLGIFSVNSLKINTIKSFIKKLNSEFNYVAKYAFNTDNTLLLNSIDFKNSKAKLFTTHHLDLSISYKEIHQNYHSDRKQRLKRVQKQNLKIIESDNIRPLIRLFKENTESKIQGGVAKETYQILEKLHRELHQRKMCQLVYSEDLTAACYFVFYKNKIIYLFNAALNESRSQNARTLILDKIIQKYAQTAYVFDFESPEVKNIADFYASFGSKAVEYYFLSYNRLPFLIRKAQELKKYLLMKNQN